MYCCLGTDSAQEDSHLQGAVDFAQPLLSDMAKQLPVLRALCPAELAVGQADTEPRREIDLLPMLRDLFGRYRHTHAHRCHGVLFRADYEIL